MLPWLLLLFICVPLVELFLLIEVARVIQVWPTIGLVVLTGVIGSWLVRWQGLQTLESIRRDLAEGRMPHERILSGILILVGGAFLITPGILTDVAGFLLMAPGNRRLILRALHARIRARMEAGGGQVCFFRVGDGSAGPGAPGGMAGGVPGASPPRDADEVVGSAEPAGDDDATASSDRTRP
ncbi:MAG: FxsA family protein [Planctomycetota bacterium]